MGRGLIVWLLIMLVETIHGVLRGLLLVPRIGPEAAARLGWPVGAVLVLAVTYLCFNWIGLRNRSNLLALGALWAVLTLVFEIAIGVLRGLDAAAIRAEINPLAGGLVIYSLIVVFLAPLIAGRLRRLR